MIANTGRPVTSVERTASMRANARAGTGGKAERSRRLVSRRVVAADHAYTALPVVPEAPFHNPGGSPKLSTSPRNLTVLL